MSESTLMGKLPPALTPGLLALGQDVVRQNQDALAWLCSGVRNVVTYSDPEIRNTVQRRLDHSVGMLCVAQIMTDFENGFPSVYWSAILSESEIQRLKAYRHIRACISNGISGTRVSTDYSEFDLVMVENGLRGVVNYDKNSFVLSQDVLNDLCILVRTLVDRAIVASHQSSAN